MKASFNVLDEPWIPVLTAQGQEEKLGIRQTLLRAQELQGVFSASPLEEYAVYRFLGLFLMDALRPERTSDLKKLLNRGCFEGEKIEAYIAECEGEGVSFDLFDEARPFLQSPPDEGLDGPVKPVGVLDCTRPTGNNHTHFYHPEAAEDRLPPDAGLRLLLATLLFSTAAAQGYPSGVYGAPPYFGIIQGSDLFETLVSTLVPVDWIGMELDAPPVLWRRREPVVPKKEVGTTSWLQGMLFPVRRIRLVHDDGGSVIGVRFCQGENYVNKESWRDPYVTYRKGKDSVFPMRPNADRAVWRNYCDIIDVRGGNASQLLSLYHSLHRGETAEMTLYGVETNQASFLASYRESLRLPSELLASESGEELLRAGIGAAEELAQELRKAMSAVAALGGTAVSQALQRFYRECEERFWSLCSEMENAGPEKGQYVRFCLDAADAALRCFTETVASAELRARQLALAAEARSRLVRSIYKLKKEVNK